MFESLTADVGGAPMLAEAGEVPVKAPGRFVDAEAESGPAE